jgi:hypothetical protein
MKMGLDNDHQISLCYNMVDIIEADVDITQFEYSDYDYAVAEDRVYVNPSSKMATWFHLKGLIGVKTVHRIQNKAWVNILGE